MKDYIAVAGISFPTYSISQGESKEISTTCLIQPDMFPYLLCVSQQATVPSHAEVAVFRVVLSQ